MRATLRLLLLIPAGFVLACYAGAFALLWPFLELRPGALADPVVVVQLAVGFTAQAAQIGGAVFVPWLLFVALAEALRGRSVLLHLAAGLAGGFVSTRLAPVEPPRSVEMASVTAGLAFALVYWLVAGHGAGRRRLASPSPSSPPPTE